MTINEFYEEAEKGLFEEMNVFDVPWKTAIPYSLIDYRFRYVKATNMKCSRICQKLTMAEIASMLFNIYKENWAKLWENYTITYSPIDNYDKTEIVTNVYGKKKNTSVTGQQINSSEVGEQTTESSDSVVPFNNTAASEVSAGSSTSGSRNDSATIGSRTDTSEDDSYTDTMTNRTTGNIGVTTSAQMVTENVCLWKWDFLDDIFNMILKDICVGVFENE